MCSGVSYPAVGTLALDIQLQQAANVHATDISSRDFFSHIGSDGSRPRQRISVAGYTHGTIGENVAAGRTAATQVWLIGCQATMAIVKTS